MTTPQLWGLEDFSALTNSVRKLGQLQRVERVGKREKEELEELTGHTEEWT